VVDDGLGSNTLSLSGVDANFFELIGDELFLKAGANLDFETKQTYSVAVSVDDPTVGTSPDAVSSTCSLNVTNVTPERVNGTLATTS
jgi:hypothetical protein